ncbi:hypothetical protein NUW58_g6913 [Xylaria curta]|uniref:Uncharacterized protein n=1 Tax=Xylaria curta TaxID=42375 RepID=A0ACC1NNY7_9PEZI|nr:hypothetical protein NUW58_g6913 [Xylaria curta]
MRSSALLAALGAIATHALSTNEWTKQSIYQLLTDRFARTDGSTNGCNDFRSYCGGTWQGIIKKLDYIQNMGFTAIWISPVVKNIDTYTAYGLPYHGYWALDFYSVNQHFGTPDDLKQLSTELHKRGMYLMVDIVVNHYGVDSSPYNVDYGQFKPFNRADRFHPYCPINYNDGNSVVKCWIGDTKVPLPDIKTEDSGVRDTLNAWIRDLVSTYGIDGLRIDTLKHVEKDFFPGFGNAAGCYLIGEAFDGDPGIYPDWLRYISGAMNYPAYYWLTNAFKSTSASMTELVNGLNQMKGMVQTKVLGSFIENHDNPRFPALTGDIALAKNAIAATMMMDGIPIIYQGQEHHYRGRDDPDNREPLWTSQYSTDSELYKAIQKLNQVRNRAIAADPKYVDYQAWPVSPHSRAIVLRKGFPGAQIVSVQTNIGSNGQSFDALTEIMSCTSITTDGSGTLSFNQNSQPKVFFPTAQLPGSGLCGDGGNGGGGGGGGDGGGDGGGGGGSDCTTVPVTFNQVVTTSPGQTIKIVGNIPELGSWQISRAVALDASQYTSSNHLWRATVNLPPGKVVEYKFINVASNGAVTWEADPNRSFTVPTTCSGVTRSDNWR